MNILVFVDKYSTTVSLSILTTTSLSFPRKACGSGFGGDVGRWWGYLAWPLPLGHWLPTLYGYGHDCRALAAVECRESEQQPGPHPRQGCTTSLSCCFTTHTCLLAGGKKARTPKYACGSNWLRLAEQLHFLRGSEDTWFIFFFFDLVISSTNKLCGWQTHSPCSIGYCRLCHKNKQNKTNQPNKKNENNNNKKTTQKAKTKSE